MKCKNCETELTFMKDAKCLRCLKCNPVNENPVKTEDKKTNYVDVPWTAERIWESVRPKIAVLFLEMLEDWHSPVDERILPRKPDNPPVPNNPLSPEDVQGVDWRFQAKHFGIRLCKETGGARKKSDVLADIAEKTAEAGNGV